MTGEIGETGETGETDETGEIDEGVAVLRRGGLVGMPTETVYGLAGDASNEAHS